MALLAYMKKSARACNQCRCSALCVHQVAAKCRKYGHGKRVALLQRVTAKSRAAALCTLPPRPDPQSRLRRRHVPVRQAPRASDA